MKKLVKYSVTAILAVVSLTGLMTLARADVASAPVSAGTAPETTAPVQGQPAVAGEDKWEFSAPLYIWAINLNGTATLKGNNIRVSEDFSELKDHMDQGLMAFIQLGKPQYGFYVNPNYFALSFDGKLPGGGDKVTLDTTMTILEMAGYYRIWEMTGDRPANLYVLGGARYWNLHNNLRISDKNPLLTPNDKSFAGGSWLLDPMIGLRFNEYITQRVHWMTQADVGGFNLAGQTSRFSWQWMANVGYDFTMPVIKKPSTVFAGWRQINVQKTSGSSTVNQDAFNLNFSGIVLGLNVELF